MFNFYLYVIIILTGFWSTHEIDSDQDVPQIKAAFTLQQKSSDSKIIRIHTKIVFGFFGRLHRKKYLG